ncbi:hypothetical protein ISN44_As12g032180 [Arabidopsis suecica]|uniref:Uncharacterized protein n=1 Tax=Arabidopsis suecica TaxID=45249 RepID=A0A8T1YPJ1_ARASU|nr:hypothetical protein ISN44_As12g032180 [Arabidopsis suecica]
MRLMISKLSWVKEPNLKSTMETGLIFTPRVNRLSILLTNFEDYVTSPPKVEMVVPEPYESPESGRKGYCCAYEIYFKGCGLFLPLPEILLVYLNHLGIAFSQMSPNMLRSLLCTFTVAAEAGYSLGLSELLELFQARESRTSGYYALYPIVDRNLIDGLPLKDNAWRKFWFFFRINNFSIQSSSELLRIHLSSNLGPQIRPVPSVDFLNFYKAVLESPVNWNSFTLERIHGAGFSVRMSLTHPVDPPPAEIDLSSLNARDRRKIKEANKKIKDQISLVGRDKKNAASTGDDKVYRKTLLVDDGSLEGSKSMAVAVNNAPPSTPAADNVVAATTEEEGLTGDSSLTKKRKAEELEPLLQGRIVLKEPLGSGMLPPRRPRGNTSRVRSSPSSGLVARASSQSDKEKIGNMFRCFHTRFGKKLLSFEWWKPDVKKMYISHSFHSSQETAGLDSARQEEIERLERSGEETRKSLIEKEQKLETVLADHNFAKGEIELLRSELNRVKTAAEELERKNESLHTTNQPHWSKSHDRDWGSYVSLGSRWPNQALGSLVHPSSNRTPLRFHGGRSSPQLIEPSMFPIRSFITTTAHGLLTVYPSGPTSVWSIGSHRGLSRWLSVESPLVTARPYTSSSRATTVHQLECQLTGPPSWVSTRSVHRSRLSCRSAHLAELASLAAGLAYLAELASSSSFLEQTNSERDEMKSNLDLIKEIEDGTVNLAEEKETVGAELAETEAKLATAPQPYLNLQQFASEFADSPPLTEPNIGLSLDEMMLTGSPCAHFNEFGTNVDKISSDELRGSLVRILPSPRLWETILNRGANSLKMLARLTLRFSMASPQGEPSDPNPSRFPSGESLFPTGDGFTPQGVAIPCFLSSMSKEEKIKCHEFMEQITERYVFLCSERQRLGKKRRVLEERIARTERKIRRLESDVHNWERRGFDSIARIPGCLRKHISFLKKHWDIYQRSLEPDERDNGSSSDEVPSTNSPPS